MVAQRKRVLFLSNGHGEDLNASLIAKALQQECPEIEIAALPIVGEGNSYHKLSIPVIGPTQNMPSGGVFYMNWVHLLKDVGAGLVSLTLQQIQAAREYSRQCDLVVAVGDIVVLAIAQLMGCKYISCLVTSSSYYKGYNRLPFLTDRCLRSSRCLQVFTRDRFTAQDLQSQGLSKATFAGCPFMDALTLSHTDLQLLPDLPTIALLPGSRLPEACQNFVLQLSLCQEIAKVFSPQPVQFRVALVPQFTEQILQQTAESQQWEYKGDGTLCYQNVTVQAYYQAFADILHHCDLVIGMTGTGVEQAVGLGKPVIQIAGDGPAFTYRFAEAQNRLLGQSVQTVGTTTATPAILQEAAQKVKHTLKDSVYLQQCQQNALERIGTAGGSLRIARSLLACLESD